MSITDQLPDRVEICECGHPSQWHSATHGFCLIALDIDEECPCKKPEPLYTLLLSPLPSDTPDMQVGEP